jgi:hypothetical protein
MCSCDRLRFIYHARFEVGSCGPFVYSLALMTLAITHPLVLYIPDFSTFPFPCSTRTTPRVTAHAVTDSKPSAARRAISHLQTDFVYTSNARTHQRKTSVCDTTNHISSLTRSIQYFLICTTNAPHETQDSNFSHPASESGVFLAVITCSPSYCRHLSSHSPHGRFARFFLQKSVKHLLFKHLLS